MIKNLIIKEIADHMKKLRVLIIGFVITLMFIVASIAFVLEYGRIVKDYKSPEQRADRIINSENISLAMAVQFSMYVQKEPNPLWFCVSGGSHIIPNLFRVHHLWNREIETSFYKTRENPWIQKLGSLDWMFLVGFLISFMAIVLSYDTISGEKEEGTLRLMLSNDIPRYKILMGKFLGIFLIIMIPLILGQFLSLFIINNSDSIMLSNSDLGRIGFIVLLSWIYAIIFIWIGLLVSSLTHNSSTSIVMLLFIWVVMLLIIPGTSGLTARFMYHLPRKEGIEKKCSSIMKEANYMVSHERDLSIAESAQIEVEALQKSAEIRNEYRNKKYAQVELARNFARLSPMAVFEYAGEASVGVGLLRHKNLIEQLNLYRERVGNFLLSEEKRVSKNPKGVLHYSTLPWKEYNSKALPIFVEQPVQFVQGLREALLDLGLLSLYGFVFFAGAFVSFNRYDVR